ncbi:hypothetical protein GCM10020000_63550 [Streptomyces olivoverticillatus]
MWITNGSVAGVAVVWAQTEEGIRGFVVPADSPGLSAPEIKHKWSLRASVTSELVLDEVRLPADAVLPEAVGLRGPLSCLSHARYGIVWGSMGAARTCFETALDYAKTREQFGRPIGGFQLTQAKLADMAVELHKGILLAHHLGRRMDAGRLRPEQVSFGKLNSVREAIEICRTARTVLGGPTGSRSNTPSCGTPRTWSRCSLTRAPWRCTNWCWARRSPASTRSGKHLPVGSQSVLIAVLARGPTPGPPASPRVSSG